MILRVLQYFLKKIAILDQSLKEKKKKEYTFFISLGATAISRS